MNTKEIEIKKGEKTKKLIIDLSPGFYGFEVKAQYKTSPNISKKLVNLVDVDEEYNLNDFSAIHLLIPSIKKRYIYEINLEKQDSNEIKIEAYFDRSGEKRKIGEAIIEVDPDKQEETPYFSVKKEGLTEEVKKDIKRVAEILEELKKEMAIHIGKCGCDKCYGEPNKYLWWIPPKVLEREKIYGAEAYRILKPKEVKDEKKRKLHEKFWNLKGELEEYEIYIDPYTTSYTNSDGNTYGEVYISGYGGLFFWLANYYRWLQKKKVFEDIRAKELEQKIRKFE